MLQLRRVGKRFDNGVVALQNIDLAVGRGEILGIVGGSGCGKSTLLRLICGLDSPTEGDVLIEGDRVTGPRPDIGVIFQEPRLMPWLDVARNVEFGLSGMGRAEKSALAREAIERVGLSPFGDALPRQLSGGMAQRVAIARALITKPSVLLLDEPFSALDAFTRLDLQDHVLQLWSVDRPTMILVTHDIDEALALSDRVVVMRGHPGRIEDEFEIDLARPRRRSSPPFQAWREAVLGALESAGRRSRTPAAEYAI
jgi:sulfonate transport system ATP-binding protein